MTMLSTLLLTFACAAPAQEPVGPLADSFPSDSFAVLELSLEPWDRLRKQTRAHEILRGQDVLTSTLSIVEQMDGELAAEDARKALSTVRVAFAATPKSIELGGVLMALEPVSFGAVSFDWPKHLQEAFGMRPVKFGRGFLTLASDRFAIDQEAALTYLKSLAATASNKEETLGGQAQWAATHGYMSTRDDLLRFTFAGWNMDGAIFERIIQIVDPGSADDVGTMYDSMKELFGLDAGAVWTTTIQGKDVVDRILLPRDPDERTAWISMGDAEEALHHFGSMQSGPGIASAYGMDTEHVMNLMDGVMGTAMELDGGAMSDDPTFLGVMASLRGCMEQLGPRFSSWQSIDGVLQEGMGNYQFQVRDKAALEAAWATMPEEVMAFIPLMMMELGGGADAVVLTEDALTVKLDVMPAEGEGMQGSTEFKQIRQEILAYLDGADPVLIQTMPIEIDRMWLSEGGGMFEILSDMFGVKVGGKIEAEKLQALRPIWIAGKRTERGLEMEGRSTFSILLSAGLMGLSQALLMDGAAPADDFDEEEF